MSPFPFLATVVVTFLISSLWAHILGPVGSSFFSFFGFSWAASANLERAGFALDWIGITKYYYYYLDWKGNGNKQQQQNGQGWRWCTYLSCPTYNGQGKLGSLWDEGAGWLDNLDPEDLFCVRPAGVSRTMGGGL